ncbi:sigma-70 family RNA polymerase sigma factor [Virgibacillus necropolis]|uniref:RNA polymerase sigma factor n=1 Tax=Virgibacillus necropolis TaxID=163877 RepID=UPI00384E9902
MNKEMVSFDEIVKQNERRIHYYIHKLNLRDPHKEYFYEGLFAMWNAYENYQPDKGPLATYFNYSIRNRLIDQMRKQKRIENVEKSYIKVQREKLEDGNYYIRSETSYPIMIAENSPDYNDLLERGKSLLSDSQRKWLQLYIVEGKSIKEIAEQEGVTCDAVKGWGREARKKLRAILGEG